MKAITYAAYGPPGVLAVSELDRPSPADGEVLVRVRAVEATKADCELRSFRFPVNWFWLPLRLVVGVFRPRRPVLGGYFAGEVAALGSGATGFEVGDRIFGSTGFGMGAYGEYVALPADACVAPMPHNMSFTDAAAVPLGGLNAIHFMRMADIREGQSVLVNGAGGSIGAHAVQIAKALGAEVIAVDNGMKESFLRRLGADHFVDYTKQHFSEIGRTVDVFFDMVAGSDYGAALRMVSAGGCYLCGNPRLSVMLRAVLTTKFSDKRARFRFASESREELVALTRMIEAGEIVPIVDRVLSPAQAAEAHTLVETEQRVGAIVLDLG